ncbi:MAG TPA: hypothetical protein VHA52_11780 [Candidatus Babeliaceae bacterium]|nr:hypothetical protein [Candidatus Babeliaceae bacterium]
MKSVFAIFLSAVVVTVILFNETEWKTDMLAWDKSDYYIYLPAAFIYHDIGHLDFQPAISQKYNINKDIKFYAIYDEAATGRRMNKYPVGVSVMELPFFLIAHAYCCLTNAYPADGYSRPYMEAIAFATAIWVIIGLIFLRSFLKRFYSDDIVAIALLLILFGTNLYSYTAFDYGMSHSFSFTLFAMLLYFTEKWYRTEKGSDLVGIGIVMGLIIITRPTNALMGLVPLCWGNWAAIVRRKPLPAFIAMLCFIGVLFIQLGYWKYTAGKWIHFSYENEGFDFSSPNIWNGLFSYRKGWFVYTPLALIALISLVFLWRQYKRLTIITGAYFLVMIYVVFSWTQWFYGGSFGCRVLIETYPLLALPLCALLYEIGRKRKIWLTTTITLVFGFTIWLNVWQNYQFTKSFLPTDGTTKELYWHIFGKMPGSA